MSCQDQETLTCCTAPPGRENFDWVRATSAGPAGVLAFFETDANGDCLRCSSTGVINSRYHNVHFETTMMINAASACPRHAKKTTAGEVLDNSTSLYKATRQVDTLTVGGYDYNISHLPLEELVKDIAADLPDQELLKKWSLDQDKATLARDVIDAC
ncbi:hypothetical protein BDV25DRAFT_138605 [Aspergillus avenaceus]|uniref:Uncharacterized protein n=1 Tax=Aspergillus avenaceus TaxID=36643 RepID=A0A5N6TZA5_ASPAV|nr:hypothetical protein BDV25DRAFT_138605 [Aspergillus avenaceus]